LYDLTLEVSMVRNTNRDALFSLEVLGFVCKTFEKIIDKIVKEDPEAKCQYKKRH
jgi:Holliday junction DNA helicase RuvA